MDLPFALAVRRADGSAQSLQETVRPSSSVGDIKALLNAGEGLTTAIIFAGRELQDTETLAAVGVTPRDFVVAVTIGKKKRRRQGGTPGSTATPSAAAGPACEPWFDHGSSCVCEQCSKMPQPAGMPANVAVATPSVPAGRDKVAKRNAEQQIEALRPVPLPPRPPLLSTIRQVTIKVSRRPVMLLWAAAVAFRLGHDRDYSLSLAGAVATIFSQFKAKHLGLTNTSGNSSGDSSSFSGAAISTVQLMAQPISVVHIDVDAAVTSSGSWRALEPEPGGSSRKLVAPAVVWAAIEKGFGAHLPAAFGAFTLLAAAVGQEALAEGLVPYSLYEQFRPKVPPGRTGWGQVGELSLGDIILIRDDARARSC